jgi:hypothetical protein
VEELSERDHREANGRSGWAPFSLTFLKKGKLPSKEQILSYQSDSATNNKRKSVSNSVFYSSLRFRKNFCGPQGRLRAQIAAMPVTWGFLVSRFRAGIMGTLCSSIWSTALAVGTQFRQTTLP